MIYENVELHNVEEVIPIEGGGVLLQRVPESVRQMLNEGAQMRMRQPDNAEIRFVGDGPVRVTVSSGGTTRVSLFHGVFDARERYVVGPEPMTIEVRPHARLAQLEEAYWRDLPFAPHVFRLILGGPQREPLILHGVEGEGVRAPDADELPGFRYLAYGTSITHGFDAEGPHLTYVGQTAWHLGADLIHPGDHAMILMGRNLGERLKGLLGRV